MAINRASISKELLPGLNAVFGMEYGEVSDEHKPLFETENSDRAFEEEVLFTGFGTAPIKAEGAAMANTKQVKAADVFNNGFNSSFTGGDGQQLFSASHPTIGDGSQSNTLGATDLSEASLESALITISKAKDDRGILIGLQTKSLHIPSDLAFTADQILNSTMSTTIGVNSTTAANGATNVNDINSIRNQGMVPGGFYVNRRFTDTNAWYLKTDCPNGAKMFVRSPLQTKMEPDFDTGNVRFKARERYSFGFSDWRSYYGASGSS